MLSKLVFTFAITRVCRAVEELKLTGPPDVLSGNTLTSVEAQTWHDTELCPKLQKLFCSDPTCLKFDNFFVEKEQSAFQFVQNDEVYTYAQYQKIVEGVKSATPEPLAKAPTDASYSVQSWVEISKCEFQGHYADQSGPIYEVKSRQTVDFVLRLAAFAKWQPTVSVVDVTYRWDHGELIEIVMDDTTMVAGEYKLASAISKLSHGRRRLMKHEPVQYIMRMPKVIGVPLMVGMIALFIALGMVLFWKSLCLCCGCLAKKDETEAKEWMGGDNI